MSCANCSCIDTKCGSKGKTFGTFLLVIHDDTPFSIQPCNIYDRLLVGGCSQFRLCNKPTGEGLSFFTLAGTYMYQKRETLSLHAHEPWLKLGGTIDTYTHVTGIKNR